MDTMKIATQYVELLRAGKFSEALETLFADDAVSAEAGAPPGGDRFARGKAAIRGKGEWWTANHDVHSFDVTGPWPNDDRFIVGFRFDVTFKPQNKRFVMEEAGLFTVKDGKIVKEEFFYSGM
ncbi:MAG: SnoaL-like domain-containing protein [Lautropia sp.]